MKPKNKKIALFGVAGFNRGDDAITSCLIQVIEQRYGSHSWFVTVQRKGLFQTGAVRELLLQRKSVEYHLKLMWAIARCDLVIIGGGSIIQDEFGSGWFRGITSIYAEIIFLAKIFR